MITHTHTRSHIHTSPSCSLVNGCCRQKTDLASVERVSQVGFEVPYKVINTAQHTAEVTQHTPHHESRRKPSVSNATVEDQMTIHAALKEGQRMLDIQRRDQPRHTQYQANPKLRVLSARVLRDREKKEREKGNKDCLSRTSTS